MVPIERCHWPGLHSLGNGKAPVAYHYHQINRLFRWRYPSLPHPSTLCHRLIPREQWTPLTERPGGPQVIYQLVQRCMCEHAAPESGLTELLAKEAQLG
jgi:hypothetical protein